MKNQANTGSGDTEEYLALHTSAQHMHRKLHIKLAVLKLFWSVGKLPINIFVNSALSELASGLHVSV